jgi:cell division protein FtsX
LPHRLYFPRIKRYSPIIFLMREWMAGVIILIIASLLTLGAGTYLVSGNLEAIAEMIRSIGLYALVLCVLFHGMALFARYVRYLYERNLDQSYKVVAVSGGAAAVVLVMSIYLFSQDFNRMATATGTADGGLLMLHLSLRGIMLLSVCLFCIAWLFSVLADH